MTAKWVRRIAVGLFIVVFFTVLGLALTSARYTTVKNPDNHTGELEYSVENQVLITTTEQFFAAIENGYSNIKIADGVANPFLVSGSADVTADLIMDLNGHEIQRNSRDPMLTVTEGVKMVVTDTSKSQTGSFYNPVGSVLKVDGGVLTVMDSKFESGARKNEYFSNQAQSDYIGGHINGATPITVTTNVKQSDGTYAEQQWDKVPVILPTVKEAEVGTTTGGSHYFVNGNIYFDSAAMAGIAAGNYNENVVKEDAYLYYTVDDTNAVTNTIIATKGSADFHYTYYIRNKSGENELPDYQYVADSDRQDDDIEVTVYGYYDVLAAAKNATAEYTPDNPSNFAAIVTKSGSIYSRGGAYYSYFGVDTSCCVYADEGNISVIDGSYTAIDGGVCIRCNFKEAASTLSVSGGQFKSYHGDTIHMMDGQMTITGGLFVKDSSAFEGADWTNHNGSAIHIENGIIDINATEESPVNFWLAGSYMAAIQCGDGATFDASYTNFTFGTTTGSDRIEGAHNMGIYGEGGNITVRDCIFIQPGDNGYGIYTKAAEAARGHTVVNVYSSVFSMGGINSRAINAQGGEINIGGSAETTATDPIPREDGTGSMLPVEAYSLFYLDHVENCYGVYAQADDYTELNVNIYSAQFLLGNGYAKNKDGSVASYYYNENPDETTATGLQANEQVWSAAVFADAPLANISLGRLYILHAGNYSAGIFARQGTISRMYNRETQDLTVAVFVGSRYKGYLNGGYKDLTSSAASRQDTWSYVPKLDSEYIQTPDYDTYYNNIESVAAQNNFGICNKGGNISLDRVYINMRSDNSRGIYSSSTTANGKVSINTLLSNVDNKDYLTGNVPQTLTTSAMVVRGGAVEIGDADVRTNGIGILLDDGDLSFTGETVKLVSLNASVLYMTNNDTTKTTSLTISDNTTVTIECTITSNDGVTPRPWSLNTGTTMQSYNGINVKGGNFICNGLLKVTFKGLDNDDQASDVYDPYSIHIKSFAVNVEELENGGRPEVKLFRADITSSVGGGVAVKGGICYLGKDLATFTEAETALLNDVYGGDYNAMIKVETTGQDRYGVMHTMSGAGNWSYYCSRTGGPAVKVATGELYVYGGQYNAAMGNGILIENGTASVYNGVFAGHYASAVSSDENSVGSGLASFCGFMLRGGGTLTIYDGTFTGFNGGAFVAGQDESHIADAIILGGTYKAANIDNGRNTNGFSVGGHANVILGKETLTETDKPIEIDGYACGIAVENNSTLGNLGSVEVTLQGGTIVTCYRNINSQGIWKGNNDAKLTLGECVFRMDQYTATDRVYAISCNQTYWSAYMRSGLNLYGRASKTATTYVQLTPSTRPLNGTGYYEYVISATALA